MVVMVVKMVRMVWVLPLLADCVFLPHDIDEDSPSLSRKISSSSTDTTSWNDAGCFVSLVSF